LFLTANNSARSNSKYGIEKGENVTLSKGDLRLIYQ
jgi:hypothetical protein